MPKVELQSKVKIEDGCEALWKPSFKILDWTTKIGSKYRVWHQLMFLETTCMIP